MTMETGYLFQNFTIRTLSSSKMTWPLQYSVNVNFENLEGQDEVSSETSAFKRDEYELASFFSYMGRD